MTIDAENAGAAMSGRVAAARPALKLERLASDGLGAAHAIDRVGEGPVVGGAEGERRGSHLAHFHLVGIEGRVERRPPGGGQPRCMSLVSLP